MKNFCVRSLLFSIVLLALAGGARAQVESGYTRLFQCDIPSDPSLKSIGGLIVERPTDPRFYRQPRLLLNFTNGSRLRFNISGASWFYFPNPLQPGNVVKTQFFGNNVSPVSSVPAIQFELRSNGSFQPLSGTLPGLGITFQTCGVQLTSNYYWTSSSLHLNEGFACPSRGQPAGCPGVGTN